MMGRDGMNNAHHSLQSDPACLWLTAVVRLVACAVLPLCAGCGYMVGGAYAPEVSTVHVPTFGSDTYRRGFELQLTEAVQKQIQLRTPYRLAKPPEAQTRLEGRIISIDKRV